MDQTPHLIPKVISPLDIAPAQPYTYTAARNPDGDVIAYVVTSSRKKYVVVEPCALCGLTKKLQLSHIVPAWAIRMFEGKGIVYGSAEGGKLKYRRQDGSKFYLLCESCEQWLGQAEDYLSLLSRGSRDEMLARGITIYDGGFLTGVERSLIIRGLLGIIFKSHFSPNASHTTVKLDRRQLVRFRQRLIRDDYPADSFGIKAIKWMSYADDRIHVRDMISVFQYSKGRTKQVHLMFGGISYFVDLHPGSADPSQLPLSSPTNDGKWNILIGDASQSVHITKNHFPDAVQLPDSYSVLDYDSSKRCPCGLPGNYGDCCREVWFPGGLRYETNFESNLAQGTLCQ